MKVIDRKSKYMLNVEAEQGAEIEELMRRMFVDQHLTQREIASKLGITYATTIRWLNKSGVYSRRLGLM